MRRSVSARDREGVSEAQDAALLVARLVQAAVKPMAGEHAQVVETAVDRSLGDLVVLQRAGDGVVHQDCSAGPRLGADEGTVIVRGGRQ